MPYLDQCYLMSRFGIRKSLAIIACVDLLNYRIVGLTKAADLSLLLPTQYYTTICLFVR